MIDKVLLDLLFQHAQPVIQTKVTPEIQARPVWAAKAEDGDYYLCVTLGLHKHAAYNEDRWHCLLIDIFAKGTNMAIYAEKHLEAEVFDDPSNYTFEPFIGKLRKQPERIIWAE